MTSCAMIAGMVPMALGLGEGGEQTAPLGRAVIGGLVAATLATLLVLPAVFALVHGPAPARSAVARPGRPGEPALTGRNDLADCPGGCHDASRPTAIRVVHGSLASAAARRGASAAHALSCRRLHARRRSAAPAVAGSAGERRPACRSARRSGVRAFEETAPSSSPAGSRRSRRRPCTPRCPGSSRPVHKDIGDAGSRPARCWPSSPSRSWTQELQQKQALVAQAAAEVEQAQKAAGRGRAPDVATAAGRGGRGQGRPGRAQANSDRWQSEAEPGRRDWSSGG